MITFPNAKINLGLNITEKRKDGFHNIETIFYPVNLCDALEFAGSSSGRTEFTITGLTVDGDPEKNLVMKAYLLLKKKFPLPPLSIHLHKVIPMGAGLGGGSSDAAFMIKSLNDFFKLKLTEEEQENYASELGSDCAFFIRNKPVFAHEKGNVFKKIDLSLAYYYIAVVHPGIHVSTPEAYASVIPEKPERSLTTLINEPVDSWKDVIKNDFEASVFKKYPLIREVKEELYRKGAVYASMSGSGSAVYGIFGSLPRLESSFDGFFTWEGAL